MPLPRGPLTNKELRARYAVAPLFRQRLARSFPLLAVPGLAGWIGAYYVDWVGADGFRAGAATTVTVGALLFALVQWRTGLEAQAVDALYERIDVANERRLAAVNGLDDAEKAQAIRDAYVVFAELDNLEYTLQKYRLGLVKAAVASRVFLRFEQRCADDPDFLAAARNAADHAAYYRYTHEFVERVAALHRDAAAGG